MRLKWRFGWASFSVVLIAITVGAANRTALTQKTESPLEFLHARIEFSKEDTVRVRTDVIEIYDEYNRMLIELYYPDTPTHGPHAITFTYAPRVGDKKDHRHQFSFRVDKFVPLLAQHEHWQSRTFPGDIDDSYSISGRVTMFNEYGEQIGVEKGVFQYTIGKIPGKDGTWCYHRYFCPLGTLSSSDLTREMTQISLYKITSSEKYSSPKKEDMPEK